MKVHRDITHLPAFKNAVITIGTFDGVHTGHQKILEQLKKEATRTDGETLIITFHPHPRMVIHEASGKKDHEIKLLNTLAEKIELLEKQGIDYLVIVPFTREFSIQSAEQYIQDFLVATFHPGTIVIGYDHRFGKGRKGDYRLLESYQEACKFRVMEIPEHVLHSITISSTIIRQALEKSDIATANEYLGYSYFFEGMVVEGDKLGRTLGFPTANVEIIDNNKLIPGNGVYAVEVSLMGNDQPYSDFKVAPKDALPLLPGMMNIGIRPTVGGSKRVIEVHILNFEGDIYEQRLRVYIKHFLREEKKFTGLEALKEQLSKDKEAAAALLTKINPPEFP